MLDKIDWDSDYVLIPISLLIFIVLRYLRAWYKKHLKKIVNEAEGIFDAEEEED